MDRWFFRCGGALFGALAGTAQAQSASDVAILNFALTLEYLEAAFYKEAVAMGALTGDTRRFARVVAAHEATHVRTLKGVLGSQAVKKPRFNFRGTTSSQGKFQATAQALEDTGVGQGGGVRGRLPGSRGVCEGLPSPLRRSAVALPQGTR